jgi:hypothetical protein
VLAEKENSKHDWNSLWYLLNIVALVVTKYTLLKRKEIHILSHDVICWNEMILYLIAAANAA